MFDVPLLIGGAAVQAASGETFERRCPVSAMVASRSAAATPADAVRAVQAAAEAFPAWSAQGPNARRKVLQEAAARMRERAPEFIERMIAETGSAQGWAGFNVMFGASVLEEAAALTTQVTGEIVPSDHGATALVMRKPAGVTLGIAPWNAPVILGVRAIAVPLAVGNTAILKASEICPATHALIVEVLNEAGAPDGAVNLITHAPADAGPVVEAMVAHPAVRRVNFTGSTRVGRIIGEMCGRHLKPVVLELGGKSPLIVLDDADLDQAVNAAAFSAYMHQGQICMSAERLIVDETIADAFVEKLKVKLAGIAHGPPAEGKPLGACVDAATVQRVQSLVSDAVAKGATVVAGTGRGEGALLAPTLVDHVGPAMALYSEESFGPVVGIVRVKGDDEAVRVANDTEYGLTAAVHSRDIGRALAVAERLETGMCHINGPTVQDEAQMPFGGTKGSGFGRFGGKAGIDAFTELRWISIQRTPRHYPF
jgi:benzaldehyde dehydrogenase (NAD)